MEKDKPKKAKGSQMSASSSSLGLQHGAKITKTPQKGIESFELTSEWVLQEIGKAKDEILKEAKNDARDKIDEQVQIDKVSLITVFGVFASIISFLTIEFQFLKTICSLEAILGYTFVLFALLFGFNIGLDYLVKSRLEKTTPKPNIYFVILVAIFAVVGTWLAMKGNEINCKENQIYRKYSKDFESRASDFDTQYSKRLDNLESKIQQIEYGVKPLQPTTR